MGEKTWEADAAKAAFNAAWELIDLEGRTPEQQIEMLLCAAASRYLWAQAGGGDDGSSLAIGDWQVAHVLSHLGAGELALLFADSAHARVLAGGWTDWRLASAEEGLARAYATLGDREARDRHAEACRRLLPELDAEDRDLIEGQLTTIQ
jgi:hypothetical protein